MSLVWTPPCSALLYSVYTDTFQFDCLASFSLCMSRFLITFLAFAPTSLHSVHFIHLLFFFFFLRLSFYITLTSLSYLPLPASSVMLFLLPLLFMIMRKKHYAENVTKCDKKKNLQPTKTTLLLTII